MLAAVVGWGALAVPARIAAAETPGLFLVVPHAAVGVVGESFSLVPATTAPGPVVYGAQGLPPGLRVLNGPGKGAILGRPDEQGHWQVRLVAHDEADGASATAKLALFVVGPSIETIRGGFPLAHTPELSGRPPASVDYAVAGDNSELGNNALNDCVVAAGYHLVLAQAAAVGRPVPAPSTSAAVRVYGELTGVALRLAGGVSEGQLLAYQAAVGLDGVRAVAASTLLHPAAIGQVELATDELGGVLAAVYVPPNPWARIWTAGDVSHRDGTHEVAVLGYGPEGPILSTWGGMQQASWGWWERSVIDVTAVVPSSFLDAGHGPSGVPTAVLLRRFGGMLGPPEVEAAPVVRVGVGEYLFNEPAAAGYPGGVLRELGPLPAGISEQAWGPSALAVSGVAKAGSVGSYGDVLVAESALGVAYAGQVVEVLPRPAPGDPDVYDLSVGETFNSTYGPSPAGTRWSAKGTVAGLSFHAHGTEITIAGTPIRPGVTDCELISATPGQVAEADSLVIEVSGPRG